MVTEPRQLTVEEIAGLGRPPEGEELPRPLNAGPEEVAKVRQLLLVVSNASATATEIAKCIGPPVTAEIVNDLLIRRKPVSRQRGLHEAQELIIAAKRLGSALQQGENIDG